MTDRLPDALNYLAQTFRPIPTRGKQPHRGWTTYQRRPPTHTELHCWWPPKGRQNVALVLGPAGNLLALNVNVKGGRNGLASLQGRPVPDTPMVITPSGGRAYLFRPPAQASPSQFGTYVYPDGFDGLEFRGTGGIQLVPSSRLKNGAYHFAEPWTLRGVRAQLADLPEWLLNAWLALDDEQPHRQQQPHTHEAQPLPPPPYYYFNYYAISRRIQRF
jgi:hypothetical protein